MDQRWKAMCGVLCTLLLPGAVLGQKVKLPDGPGKAELIRDCTACHNSDLVVQVKKTPEAWKKSVYEMADRGVDASDAELDKIVRYLSTNFGVEKSTATATQSAAPSTSSRTGEDRGRLERYLELLPNPNDTVQQANALAHQIPDRTP